DESTTGIGGLNCFEWCALVAKSDHGQVAHIERARQIADADIQRSRKRVISDIRSIVTCAACTGDDGYAELVVQSGDPRDVNRLAIEQGLTARDAPARAADGRSRGLRVRPAIEQAKDDRRETIVKRIETEIRPVDV